MTTGRDQGAVAALRRLVEEECPGVAAETSRGPTERFEAMRFHWTPPLEGPIDPPPDSVTVYTSTVTHADLIACDDLLELAERVAGELRGVAP